MNTVRTKTKHKISRETDMRINDIVGRLPVMPRYKRSGEPLYKPTQCTGKYLRSIGEKKDKNGVPINPDTVYIVPMLQYTDHRKMLVAAYQVAGDAGMDRYEESVRAAYRDKQEELKNSAGWWTRLKQWFAGFSIR